MLIHQQTGDSNSYVCLKVDGVSQTVLWEPLENIRYLESSLNGWVELNPRDDVPIPFHMRHADTEMGIFVLTKTDKVLTSRNALNGSVPINQESGKSQPTESGKSQPTESGKSQPTESGKSQPTHDVFPISVVCLQFIEKDLSQASLDAMTGGRDILFLHHVETNDWSGLEGRLTENGYGFCRKQRRFPSTYSDAILYKLEKFRLLKLQTGLVSEDLVKVAMDIGIQCDISQSVDSDVVWQLVILQSKTTKRCVRLGSVDVGHDAFGNLRPDLKLAQAVLLLKKTVTVMPAEEQATVLCISGLELDERYAMMTGRLDDLLKMKYHDFKTVEIKSIDMMLSLPQVALELFEHDVRDLRSVSMGSDNCMDETLAFYSSDALQIVSETRDKGGHKTIIIDYKG